LPFELYNLACPACLPGGLYVVLVFRRTGVPRGITLSQFQFQKITWQWIFYNV